MTFWHCTICVENYTVESSISAAPCGHIFHSNCLNRWIFESKTCPHCRRSVSLSSVVRLYPVASVVESSDIQKLESDLIELNDKLNTKEEKIHDLQNKNGDLATRIRNAENDAASFHQQKLKLEDQLQRATLKINHLALQVNTLDNCKRQVDFLKNEVNRMQGLTTVIEGCQSDVEEMLEVELNYTNNENYKATIKKLATYICALKRELNSVTDKKANLFNEMIRIKSCYGTTHRRYLRLKEEFEIYKKRHTQFENSNETLNEINCSANVNSVDRKTSACASTSTAAASSVAASPLVVNFPQNHRKIEVIVIDDNCEPSTSCALKSDTFSKPTILNDDQTDSITRVGYNGLGGHESIVIKSEVMQTPVSKIKKRRRL